MIGPTQPTDRVPRIDVLRGFALFGVLLVNLFESDTVSPGAADSWIGKAVNFLAEGSFYPLFSMLFGLGFALQMSRFQANGWRFAVSYVRRSLALVAIGVASFVFILGNPILIRYGSLAFLLLPFRRASQRAVLIASAVTLLAMLGVGPARKAWADHQRAAPTTAASFNASVTAQQSEARAIQGRVTQAMNRGTYTEIVAVRWIVVRRSLLDPWFYFGARSLSMFMLFLVGLAVARRGVITGETVDARVLRRVATYGFALGIAGNAFLLAAPRVTGGLSPFLQRWASDAVGFIANPALGLAYGALLLMVNEASLLWRTLRNLAWVGRMALTNFLLQFVFMLFLFYLQRLQVFENTSGRAAVMLSVLVFALQVRLSQWWLSSFRFGPVEWIWRLLTFGTVTTGTKRIEPVVGAEA